ncbi:hypothetical protein LINPERHAP1_LOCUS21881 [Linum perenne]
MCAGAHLEVPGALFELNQQTFGRIFKMCAFWGSKCAGAHFDIPGAHFEHKRTDSARKTTTSFPFLSPRKAIDEPRLSNLQSAIPGAVEVGIEFRLLLWIRSDEEKRSLISILGFWV